MLVYLLTYIAAAGPAGGENVHWPPPLTMTEEEQVSSAHLQHCAPRKFT